ncbi:MAG: hypothetical protein ACT6RP_20540 [Roseateles sp.]|uniref:hypothetical protein n=2 Tax=Roseateles sp. TaxID=1971397 RepID=UPI0040359E6C
MPELLAEPRWADAAQALIDGCVDLGPRQEGAVALMETVCSGLGDQLYPAFLRVLAEVNLRGEYAARAAVAQTLTQALCQGRLPSGSRAAWGSYQPGAQRRSLGPIEYLCLAAWPGREQAALSPEQFQTLAGAVMDLLDCDAEARRLYADHLSAVADDPLDGTMPREVRAALRALAQSWRAQPDASPACKAFVDGLNRALR